MEFTQPNQHLRGRRHDLDAVSRIVARRASITNLDRDTAGWNRRHFLQRGGDCFGRRRPRRLVFIGQLPSGLGLSSSTGVISGTPTQAGAFTFAIQVTDRNSATASSSYTVNISAAILTPLQISTTSLPGGTVGTAYRLL